MGLASTAVIELSVAALCYSAVTLGLISANFAVTVTIVVWLLSAPLGYFVAYRMTLAKMGLSPRQ